MRRATSRCWPSRSAPEDRACIRSYASASEAEQQVTAILQRGEKIKARIGPAGSTDRDQDTGSDASLGFNRCIIWVVSEGFAAADTCESALDPGARIPRLAASALDRRSRRHSYPGLCSGLARATLTLSPSPHAGWGLVVKLCGSVAGRTEPGTEFEEPGSLRTSHPDLLGREPRPTAGLCLGRGGP